MIGGDGNWTRSTISKWEAVIFLRMAWANPSRMPQRTSKFLMRERGMFGCEIGTGAKVTGSLPAAFVFAETAFR